MAQLRDEITADPFVQMMDDVDAAVTSTNPVTKLLKELNIAIGS